MKKALSTYVYLKIIFITRKREKFFSLFPQLLSLFRSLTHFLWKTKPDKYSQKEETNG